jgi:CheY-like chemotaxis protein
MFVSRLGQLEHSTQTRDLIVNLGASVDAIQNLLDSLLDISKLDANAVSVNLQPFPLMPLLESLRNTLAPVAISKGLQLRVRPTQAWVLSDPVLLQRILLNLLSNALRYTHQGGVLLGCRSVQGGQGVRIEICDTGVGIAKEEQALIFREFYQVANPERDRSKGLGLGLNIVQRTAALLNCKLEMRSLPGVGSRFSLVLEKSLPIAFATPKIIEMAEISSNFKGLKVLVIEDDELVAQALEILLQSWNCTTKHVEGFEDGLLLLHTGWQPEMILSDYRLRDKESGIDAVLQLRKSMQAEVPACLMSGDTDVHLIEAAREASLTLLHKPVRPAKLRSLMRNLLQPAGSDFP